MEEMRSWQACSHRRQVSAQRSAPPAQVSSHTKTASMLALAVVIRRLVTGALRHSGTDATPHRERGVVDPLHDPRSAGEDRAGGTALDHLQDRAGCGIARHEGLDEVPGVVGDPREDRCRADGLGDVVDVGKEDDHRGEHQQERQRDGQLWHEGVDLCRPADTPQHDQRVDERGHEDAEGDLVLTVVEEGAEDPR